MRRDRDDQQGEPRPGRLQQEPPESRARAPEASVTRNPHGQSLGDARELFWREWEGQIEELRRQAAWTRKRATVLAQVSPQLWKAGFRVGGVLGAIYRVDRDGFSRLWEGLILGALLGIVLALPLMLLTRAASQHYQRQADRLERRAGEMAGGED
jgi:hypothetical protein